MSIRKLPKGESLAERTTKIKGRIPVTAGPRYREAKKKWEKFNSLSGWEYDMLEAAENGADFFRFEIATVPYDREHIIDQPDWIDDYKAMATKCLVEEHKFLPKRIGNNCYKERRVGWFKKVVDVYFEVML